MTPSDLCIVTIREEKGPAVKFGDDHREEFEYEYPLGIGAIMQREWVEPCTWEMREREGGEPNPDIDFTFFRK